jgi:hypothetical protein
MGPPAEPQSAMADGNGDRVRRLCLAGKAKHTPGDIETAIYRG